MARITIKRWTMFKKYGALFFLIAAVTFSLMLKNLCREPTQQPDGVSSTTHLDSKAKAMAAHPNTVPLSPSDLDRAYHPALRDSYGKLPMSFERNQGQTDRKVKFLSRGSGYSFFLTSDEAVLALRPPAQDDG